MRAAGFLALILLTGAARAEMVEVLDEGGIQVSFEKTGDQDQIVAFRSTIVPEVKSILESLSSDLGTPPPSNAKVYFYSVDTFAAKFPQTTNSRIPAFYDGNGVQARADNDLTHAMKQTLRHELTHLILGKTYGRMPAWINEGLAVLEERAITEDPAPSNVDYNTLHIAKQDGKYVPLERLEAQGIFGRSHGTVTSSLAYTTAFVAVYELRQKAGMDAIRQYLKAVSSGKGTRSEFEAVFGMSYAQFDEQLLKTASEKT